MAYRDLTPFFHEHNLLLAPMAGVSDAVFRQLAEEQGCTLAYSEMVSAKGLSYANEKTRHLVDTYPGETLIAVQLFGHEPQVMAEEARWLVDELGDALAFIDVNMGCPARKIVKKGDGSALMTTPALAAEIVEAINNAVECAVTTKFRRGFYTEDETCVAFAKLMQEAGASAVTVHGRYSTQLYRGGADWACIKRVREALDIPVVGNGDIFDGAAAKRMVDETGCNAVMIARGAMGNPWIFADATVALSGEGSFNRPTIHERISCARRHAAMLAERDARQLVRMRRHAMCYVQGLPGASIARGKLNYCSTLEDFNAVFDELECHLKENE